MRLSTSTRHTVDMDTGHDWRCDFSRRLEIESRTEFEWADAVGGRIFMTLLEISCNDNSLSHQEESAILMTFSRDSHSHGSFIRAPTEWKQDCLIFADVAPFFYENAQAKPSSTNSLIKKISPKKLRSTPHKSNSNMQYLITMLFFFCYWNFNSLPKRLLCPFSKSTTILTVISFSSGHPTDFIRRLHNLFDLSTVSPISCEAEILFFNLCLQIQCNYQCIRLDIRILIS